MAETTARVLLAENDPIVARPLIAQLQAARFDVTWVETVNDLRVEMEAGTPDVLVLDDTLDTDGLEFLQAIRFAPNHPRAGVVVISESVIARERGLQLGASGAVAKPIVDNELVRTLEELLAYI